MIQIWFLGEILFLDDHVNIIKARKFAVNMVIILQMVVILQIKHAAIAEEEIEMKTFGYILIIYKFYF